MMPDVLDRLTGNMWDANVVCKVRVHATLAFQFSPFSSVLSLVLASFMSHVIAAFLLGLLVPGQVRAEPLRGSRSCGHLSLRGGGRAHDGLFAQERRRFPRKHLALPEAARHCVVRQSTDQRPDCVSLCIRCTVFAVRCAIMNFPHVMTYTYCTWL